MEIDKDYVLSVAQNILQIDSPSGYCQHAIEWIEREAKEMGYAFARNRKGNGIIHVPGQESGYTIGLGVHVDTLGAMVRSIAKDGTLRFVTVGGVIWPTADGEYCRVITRDGRQYTGTFLSDSPAAHVYPGAKDKARSPETMHVRLDEMVRDKADVEALGICAGDFICLDPKTQITEAGFIKSRFIDDKINVASLFGLLRWYQNTGERPRHDLKLIFSTYEEVGHGSAHIPPDIDEFLAVDMGCIGLDLSCTEYDVSICAKDTSGPYDYGMVSRLIELAKAENLQYAVDVYPFYNSDASAALRGGNDIKAALIGPGVHASHGMERTHYQGVENTIQLLIAYLK